MSSPFDASGKVSLLDLALFVEKLARRVDDLEANVSHETKPTNGENHRLRIIQKGRWFYVTDNPESPPSHTGLATLEEAQRRLAEMGGTN